MSGIDCSTIFFFVCDDCRLDVVKNKFRLLLYIHTRTTHAGSREEVYYKSNKFGLHMFCHVFLILQGIINYSILFRLSNVSRLESLECALVYFCISDSDNNCCFMKECSISIENYSNFFYFFQSQSQLDLNLKPLMLPISSL